jgi:hypothetical protein
MEGAGISKIRAPRALALSIFFTSGSLPAAAGREPEVGLHGSKFMICS